MNNTNNGIIQFTNIYMNTIDNGCIQIGGERTCIAISSCLPTFP